MTPGPNRTRHNAARTDDRVAPDLDSRQHDHATPEPRAFSDCDGMGRLEPAGTLPRIPRVVRCEQLHTRTELHVITERDGCGIQEDAVHVHVHSRTHADLRAVVAVERRLHPRAVAHLAEEFAQQRSARVIIGRVEHAESLREPPGTDAPVDQLLIARVVGLAEDHLLSLVHQAPPQNAAGPRARLTTSQHTPRE